MKLAQKMYEFMTNVQAFIDNRNLEKAQQQAEKATEPMDILESLHYDTVSNDKHSPSSS